MKVKNYDGYEIYISEETGKVEYALIETTNGFEKLFRTDMTIHITATLMLAVIIVTVTQFHFIAKAK